MYYFAFENSITSQPISDLIKVNSLQGTIDVSGSTIATTATVTGEFDLTNADGLRIYMLILKGGSMTLRSRCDFGNDFNYSISFPTILSQATFAPVIINGSYTASTQSLISSTESILGYKVDLIGATQSYDKLPYVLNLTFPNGTSNITAAQNLNAKVSFANIDFKYAEVATDQSVLLPLKSVDVPIKIFDSKYREANNLIYIANPSFEIVMQNSTGGNLLFSIENLRSFTPDVPSEDRLLVGAGIDSLKNFLLGPADYFTPRPSVVVPYSRKFILSSRNTNLIDIVNFFQFAPQRIGYDVAAKMQNDINAKVYLIDTAKVRMNMTSIIPCDGSITRYVLSDTSKIELPAITGDLSIDNVEIKLTIFNQFPLNLSGQIYFVDDNYKKVDSLIVGVNGVVDTVLARGGIPSPNPPYKVDFAGINSTTRFFSLNQTRYNNIQSKAKYLLFRANINTPGATDTPAKRCRVYDNYKIRVKAGIKVAFTKNF